MSTTGIVLSLVVLSLVFLPAAVILAAVVGSMLYSPTVGTGAFMLGWRTVTCPKLHRVVQIKRGHVREGNVRRPAVLRCTVFGDRRPRCRQLCLSAPSAAGA